MSSIYLDSAATMPTRREACEAMLEAMQEGYANPSSPHNLGRRAARRLNSARAELASAIGCAPDRLIFTSGGTEANNLALFGRLAVGGFCGKHLLVSAIEHKSILGMEQRMTELGAEFAMIPANRSGIVTMDAVRAALRPETILVSVMLVNNEIGTLQPIEEIGAFLRARNVTFHVDAVQGLGKVPLRLDQLPVDLMSFSAHKAEGPRGVGALYVAHGTELVPQLVGGPQEHGLRAGTENLPAIVGFARAVKLAVDEQGETVGHLSQLQDQFEVNLRTSLGDKIQIIGADATRASHITNVLFRDIDANWLLRRLNQLGICATSGSACQSASLSPSHVLTALGLSRNEAQSAVRFSYSRHTTVADLDYVVKLLREIHCELGLPLG